MTSPEDVKAALAAEAKNSSFTTAILKRIPFELRARDLEYLGYSVKFTPGYVLLTLRCFSGESKVVCFVGAATQEDLFIKAARLAHQDRLDWVVDKYV